MDLQRLVDKWRKEAGEFNYTASITARTCADELAEVIAKQQVSADWIKKAADEIADRAKHELAGLPIEWVYDGTYERIIAKHAPAEVIGRNVPDGADRISIEVFQSDWRPGFAAFLDDGSLAEGAPAHVILNIGSLLCAVKSKDLDSRDLPYLIAETLMHEVIHCLESWAKVEFSEDRVEELLTKYREKYARATIWEYTGAPPHEAESPIAESRPVQQPAAPVTAAEAKEE